MPESTIVPSSDFFDMGGHSLLLAKMSAGLLKDAGVVVSIPTILENPTFRELAALVDEEMTHAEKGLASTGVDLLTPTQR